MVILTAIIAGSTIAQAVMAGLQNRNMRKTMEETRKAAEAAFASAWGTHDQAQIAKAALTLSEAQAKAASEQSAESLALGIEHARATQLAASATLRSAEATERALLDIERPRLIVVPEALADWETDARLRWEMMRIQGDLPFYRSPRGRCWIENCGRMPAWIIECSFQFEVIKTPLPPSPQYSGYVPDNGVPIPPSTTDRNGRRQMYEELTITPNEQSETLKTRQEDRAVEAVFYGIIKYRGVFTDVEPYVTQFCFLVQGWNGSLVPGGPLAWTRRT